MRAGSRFAWGVIPVLALAGCATLSGASLKQNLYAAFGGYGAALDGAATYANSPSASPAIVAKMSAINQSEPVKLAVKYGRAFVLCDGSNTTVIATVDCKLFDFRPQTAQGYINTLRSAITTLTAR